MKPVIILAGLFMIIGSLVSAQDKEVKWDSISGQPVRVNALVHDFGVVKENSKMEFEFEFINDSAGIFIIKHVTTSCGCTTPKYSKRPIKSNKKAIVKIIYDSSRIGAFTKSVFVYTNFADEPIELKIKGRVQPEIEPSAKGEGELTKQPAKVNTNLPK